MSKRSDPWDDIETVLDLVRVEEEVLLAVLEALGELYDPEADEFSWDEFASGDFPVGARPWGELPQVETPWGDSPMNALHN
jgi:hypothetical protein